MPVIEGTKKMGGLGRGESIWALGQYDFAVDGGAVGAITLRGDSIPSGAIIVNAVIDVDTALTSGGAATVSVGTEGAADIQAAAAISGAPWSTAGAKVPTKTATSAHVTTTASRAITATVATAALTAGKFSVMVEYVVPVS